LVNPSGSRDPKRWAFKQRQRLPARFTRVPGTTAHWACVVLRDLQGLIARMTCFNRTLNYFDMTQPQFMQNCRRRKWFVKPRTFSLRWRRGERPLP
jgi:hypothetical protein